MFDQANEPDDSAPKPSEAELLATLESWGSHLASPPSSRTRRRDAVLRRTALALRNQARGPSAWSRGWRAAAIAAVAAVVVCVLALWQLTPGPDRSDSGMSGSVVAFEYQPSESDAALASLLVGSDAAGVDGTAFDGLVQSFDSDAASVEFEVLALARVGGAS
ncbi:MAG: hypothetical protein O2819_05805 [Planctomycetota bacterium]|nr:hypothetical protein [Planctomycetota bacterium]